MNRKIKIPNLKNVLTAALLMIAIHFFANQAIADMYKWVDENGVIHFSDVPPASEQNVETIKTLDYQAPSPSPAPAKPQIDAKPTPKMAPQGNVYNKRKGRRNYTNKVEIYTTSWCRYCKNAIAFLRSNHIKFEQYDIERDPKANARMKALGGTGGVPFAIINGEQVVGFSANAYKQALGLPL